MTNIKNITERFSLTGKDSQGNKIKTDLMGINEASGMAKRIGLTGTIWFNIKSPQSPANRRSIEARYWNGDK